MQINALVVMTQTHIEHWVLMHALALFLVFLIQEYLFVENAIIHGTYNFSRLINIFLVKLVMALQIQIVWLVTAKCLDIIHLDNAFVIVDIMMMIMIMKNANNVIILGLNLNMFTITKQIMFTWEYSKSLLKLQFIEAKNPKCINQ